MSYKLKNTALDHDKRFLHRKASKMQMEPVIGGRRLRIRQSMVISDELFEHNRANLELWNKWGVVSWEKAGGEGPSGRHIPSVEEITKAGYSPEAAEKIIARETELAQRESAQREREPDHTAPSLSEFGVRLMSVGDSPITVVKVLREQTSMSLREAGDLAAVVPVTVAEGLEIHAADKLVAALTEAGGAAEVTRRSDAPAMPGPTPSLVPEPLVPENYTPPPESKSGEERTGLFSEPSSAETTRVETKPQPKSPFKGKKQ